MRLLNRYLLRHWGRFFFLALATFVGIYLLVDFFEKVDDFIEHRAPLTLYLTYFLNKIPLIVSQVSPLAMLMGMFMTLGSLSRSNELTALSACGVSLLRLTAPLLGVAALFSLLVLASNEYLVPLCLKKTNHIWHNEMKGKPEATSRQDRLWVREGNQLINIRLAFPDQQLLQGITSYTLGPHFNLLSRSDAAQATFAAGAGWTCDDVIVRNVAADSGHLVAVDQQDQARLALTRTPEDFKVSLQKNEEMGYGELRALAQKLQAEGYDATRYRVDMQSRLATPFANIIMAFLGIPFALQRGRGSSLAMGVTISIGIGIVFFLIQATLLAFGYSGVLPAVIAVWAPNLLFSLLGLWLLLSTGD